MVGKTMTQILRHLVPKFYFKTTKRSAVIIQLISCVYVDIFSLLSERMVASKVSIGYGEFVIIFTHNSRTKSVFSPYLLHGWTSPFYCFSFFLYLLLILLGRNTRPGLSESVVSRIQSLRQRQL